jgi:hypothetical protein
MPTRELGEGETLLSLIACWLMTNECFTRVGIAVA